MVVITDNRRRRKKGEGRGGFNLEDCQTEIQSWGEKQGMAQSDWRGGSVLGCREVKVVANVI